MIKNIKNISKILNKDIIKYTYNVPRILVENIDKILEDTYKFDKNNGYDLRKYNNYKDCALFFIIYIMYFNSEKNEFINHVKKCDKEIYNYKFDSEVGCQIQALMLRKILNSSKYEEIKQLLINNKIIKMVPLSWNKKIYYSKEAKKAIKYSINGNYLTYYDCIEVQNKYVDKYKFLYQNDVLFGETRNALDINYVPFEDEERNYQYKLQKTLYFDENEFKKIFSQKYSYIQYIPDVYNKIENILIYKDKNNNLFNKDTLCDYKIYYNIQRHIFKSSESNGRIYLPFHYISKEYRQALRLDGYKLKEIYDIKCCFLYLSTMLFKEKTNNIEDSNKLFDLINKDIYTLLSKDLNIDRNFVKKFIMKFLFTVYDERNDSGNLFYLRIVNYFKHNHPSFYNWLQNYELIYNNERKKYISKLSYDCMKIESDIMFNIVLPYLRMKYKDIKFLSLHDGIWTTTNISIDFKDEINYLINSYNKEHNV